MRAQSTQRGITSRKQEKRRVRIKDFERKGGTEEGGRESGWTWREVDHSGR